MGRRAARLLLAVVLAAVLFNPGAVEGKKEPPVRPEGVVPSYHRCRTGEVTRRNIANSPVNKVPIGKIIGTTETVCKPVQADDVLLVVQDEKPHCNMQLVFHDEERRCDEECKGNIKRGLLEAIKHYNDLVTHIYKEMRSIQDLKNYICDDESAEEGENNKNKIKRGTMKDIGRMLKEIPLEIQKLWQKEKPNREKACKELKGFPEVKFSVQKNLNA